MFKEWRLYTGSGIVAGRLLSVVRWITAELESEGEFVWSKRPLDTEEAKVSRLSR